MNLTKGSFHYNFYKFWWSASPPNNLCNYFWGLVLALVTLPLIAGRAVYEFAKEYPGDTPVLVKLFFYIINTFMVFALGIAVGAVIGHSFYYPIEALAFFGGLTLVVIVAILVVYFFVETEVPEMTYKAVKSKKDNVCPMIQWH